MGCTPPTKNQQIAQRSANVAFKPSTQEITTKQSNIEASASEMQKKIVQRVRKNKMQRQQKAGKRPATTQLGIESVLSSGQKLRSSRKIANPTPAEKILMELDQQINEQNFTLVPVSQAKFG